jgi:hypothetical protein
MHRWTPVALMAALACATTLDPAVAEEPAPECPVAEAEPEPTEYERKLWRHWADVDKDCQDARQEVLIRDSEVPVTYTDERQCRVATGKWTGPYTGTVVEDPSKVDVDHLVALQDAHVSGGWEWDADKRKAFANDEEHLLATTQFGNRSKGAKGPDEWLPPLEAYRCGYIARWLAVKEGHELTMTAGEAAVISYMQKICTDGGVPPLPQN